MWYTKRIVKEVRRGMKRFIPIIFGIIFVVFLSGCGKKQTVEEAQEPISMESLSAVTTEAKTALPDSKTQQVQTAPIELEPLPPAGPYKPTVQEIQTALKNAGFYTGAIDGKKGPLTTKATEEFQKSKGLKVDGKVGPKTWIALSAYLNPPVEASSNKTQ